MWFKCQSSRHRHRRNLFAFLITRIYVFDTEREREGVPAGIAFYSSCHLLMRLGSDGKMFNV